MLILPPALRGKVTSRIRRFTLSVCTLVCFLIILLGTGASVLAQSQALNGQIEGTVTDANGAALPNVSITITNIETGTTRIVTSDEGGVYRAPLLPLGTYRISVETANFKRLVREGITLATGQTATIALILEPGGVAETVTITSDAPIADVAKIDLGRVLNEREVRNLPLVSRNPYNFGLLQSNVVGRPNSEFGVPRISANGYARRTNYQLDGNNNTQTDRAGIRLMPISEIFVSEVQLVTNGFAAEFGNTPGIIFNTVTPAGTNDYRGNASYRFRRTAFSSRPFFFDPNRPKPGTKVDDFAGAIGGPIIRDRWQFYTGYERVSRDLAGEPQRVISITGAQQQQLVAAGVSASAFPGAIPTSQKVDFFIVRSDAQLTDEQRLVGRYNLFRNTSPDNIAGGILTLERSVDFIDASDSVGVQLISTFTPTFLNELRYQYARRNSRFVGNDNSGTGPSILIRGIAQLGAPEDDDTIAPLETSNQILNNVTLTRGDHTVKLGGGINFIKNERRSNVFARYEFTSIANYAAARSGANPRAYALYVESLGDPNIEYDAQFYQFFAQDDWKITPRLKLNYGLRYDLYAPPDADGSAPLAFSREFRIDRNNFAPRLGVVYGLREGDRPTVVRASAGLYYEPPLLDIYRRAIISNGSPRYFTVSEPPFINNVANPNAPLFPNTLATVVLPRQSIDAVAPDYENLAAYHTNLQLEQALTQNLSVTFGFIRSRGTHIPVYRNINRINPIGTLADGRPVFSDVVNPATRLYPQFNNVLIVESVGNSDYNAGTLSLNKRFATGYQFSVNYTYSHSIDDAPEQNLVAATSYALSDPTDRRRDRGDSLADQRHTFIASFVGRPTFQTENRFLRRLLNDNQLGVIAIANSGENFNITANTDANNDGIAGSDRPLFVGRNTGRTPNQFNVDLRYSRFITFSERLSAEIFGEFINVFNRNSVVTFNGVLPVNATTNSQGVVLPDLSAAGRLTAGGVPASFPIGNPPSLDSRQFQLGFKFNF